MAALGAMLLASPAGAQNTIKVGVPMPLSGPAALYGEPAVKGARGSSTDSAASVVVLVDRSGSMAAMEDKKALGTRASEAASSVLESLAPGDEVQIVPFDAAPEPLFPKPTPDHGRAVSALSSITPRPHTTDLEAVVLRDATGRQDRPLREAEEPV